MAQHELSNKEIIVRLLKSDLSDYDNLLPYSEWQMRLFGKIKNFTEISE